MNQHISNDMGTSIAKESSIVHQLIYRFVPYWPLFLLLLMAFLPIAFLYSLSKKPVYSITATVVINDEQKGSGEGSMLRSLNVYATNKIVENEVQILRSRTLLYNVINNLSLYAPVSEKTNLGSISYYPSSPVIIRSKDPEHLKEQKDIYFDYDYSARSVIIGGKSFPVGRWVTFPFGTLMFEDNNKKVQKNTGQLFFSLVSPIQITETTLNRLKVNQTSKLATIINIAYTDEIPERGVDIINGLLMSYNKASIEAKNQIAGNTLAFVDERLDEVQHELDSIERRIQQFRSGNEVVDISQQGRLYLENISENDRKTTDINIQLSVLDQVERFVRSGRNSTGIIPTTLGIDDPVLSQLLQRLNNLELEHSNLRTTLGENNPMVQSVVNEITKIRPNILNIINNQRARLQAGRKNINATNNQFSAKVRTLPEKERQLLEISREQATKQNVYNFLLQKKEEAAISNASMIADTRVVDRPQASITPVGLGKSIILVSAVALAFIFAVAYVLCNEIFSSKILFRSEIEKAIKIPVIGELIHRKKRSKNLLSLFHKQWDELQFFLNLFDQKTKSQKILITSFLPNEGKTFVTSELAEAIANTGKKVLVLDLNLYSPQLSALLSTNEEKGFTDFAKGQIGKETLIQPTKQVNIDIITAGSPSTHPLSLLSSSKLNELLTFLETMYEFILIDTPPIESKTDAHIIAIYADMVLFIVKHDLTPKSLFHKFDKEWNVQQPIRKSILFNDVKGRGFFIKYYGFGYGYGYDYVYKNRYTIR
jgi:tyrosine-protein kinase Etk/Wzc